MLNLRNALKANRSVALRKSVVRLHQAESSVANSAFQGAVPRAMVLMESVSHTLFRLGDCLGRSQPAIGCRHSCSARKAEDSNCSTSAFQKASASESARGAFRFGHLSSFIPGGLAFTNGIVSPQYDALFRSPKLVIPRIGQIPREAL